MTNELKTIIKEIEVAIKKFEELPQELSEKESIIRHLKLAWLEMIQARKEWLELKNNSTSG